MLYREAGQFKTSYEKDAAIFPILQDRIGMAVVLVVAFAVVPFVATPYVFTGILIPLLIFSLAALGLNILTGYAGQLSLGTAAFMAVGAFAAYNFMLRVPGIPVLVAFALAGVVAALVGILFGLPSLRIRGLYLVVATLAAQFFIVWFLTRVGWITNYSTSGVITAQQVVILGYAFTTPAAKYLLGVGQDFRLLLKADDYFDFIILLMLGMGLVFQMPAITYVLARIGIVNASFLVRVWKTAAIVILVAAAVLSPTSDIPNMMLFAAPMFVLYVVSIFVAWIFGKPRTAS